MDEFSQLARDPAHRRSFEKLLYMAAKRGDADLVAERLSWGIDPNCSFARGRTPLIANVRGSCPSAAVVRALLSHKADPNLADHAGLTALDYARRKLAILQTRSSREPAKSPSLDENNQLQLGAAEQKELDELRKRMPDLPKEFLSMWWQERLRAARRVFNDPAQLEQIIDMLADG